jgi:hypothetical protein
VLNKNLEVLFRKNAAMFPLCRPLQAYGDLLMQIGTTLYTILRVCKEAGAALFFKIGVAFFEKPFLIPKAIAGRLPGVASSIGNIKGQDERTLGTEPLCVPGRRRTRRFPSNELPNRRSYGCKHP